LHENFSKDQDSLIEQSILKIMSIRIFWTKIKHITVSQGEYDILVITQIWGEA